MPSLKIKRLVCLLYCLSGLLGLGYQVVWFRILVERFGSTNLTFALVVVNFIGGLGLGSLCSGRLAAALARGLRLRGPLTVYGALELLIFAVLGLTALTQVFPLHFGGSFPYQPHDGIFQQTLPYRLGKIAYTMVMVFTPCFFMGTTFPLLCRVFPDDARFPSTLYGWNTLGACLGLLCCEFFFLPRVGYDQALWILMALNLLLGLFFLLRGGAWAEGDKPRFEHEHAHEKNPQAAISPSALLACAVASGLLCGALEGDVFQRLRFVSFRHAAAMSFITFWAILAIFLASWTVRAWRGLRFSLLRFSFAAALGVYALTQHYAYRLLDWSADTPLLPTELLKQFAMIGIFVLPAYFLVSLLLPFICNRLQGGGRGLGRVYGVNTIAFCLGLLAFTWGATQVSIFYSFKVLMGLFTLLALFLFTLRAARPVGVWRPAAFALALAALCLATPRGFDRSFFRPGSAPATLPVRAMKSNGAHTTYVVQAPDGDRLFFDSHSMSATNATAQCYMRLMAHFPLLAQPAPRTALLICFGVGNTASAIAAHPSIRRLDIVDLDDKIFETAPEFARTNGRVDRDPRVRLIHDDGRNYLNATAQTYDLVTSEPPPPLQEGVYRLYSREYYEAVARHLTPQGMMTQWLPIEQMPQETVEEAVSTFVSVFPHSLIFVGAETNLILLGGKAPLELGNIERRFAAAPRVRADLAALGIVSPLQLLARIVQGPATLRRIYGARPVISDQRNDLAYLVFSPRRATVAYDPAGMLEEIGAGALAGGAGLQVGADLRAICLNLALLRSAVPDFPERVLMTVRDTRPQGVAFAGADWKAITDLNGFAAEALAAGRTQEGAQFLERSLALAGEQARVLLELAGAQRRLGQPDEARATLARLKALHPLDPLLLRRIADFSKKE